jgi:hypothetical protein
LYIYLFIFDAKLFRYEIAKENNSHHVVVLKNLAAFPSAFLIKFLPHSSKHFILPSCKKLFFKVAYTVSGPVSERDTFKAFF